MVRVIQHAAGRQKRHPDCQHGRNWASPRLSACAGAATSSGQLPEAHGFWIQQIGTFGVSGFAIGGFGPQNPPAKENVASEALALHKIKRGASSRRWRSVACGYW